MNSPRPPVGQNSHRLEDPQFLCGTARYVGDIPLDGVLTVAFVRSPLGHAKVKGRSFDDARAMPGVVAVFGPDDLDALGTPIPPMGVEKGIQQRPPSPLTNEVRFAGDAVAIVVADDPYRAADAVETVGVDYDELPAVLNAADAMADGIPLVHDDVPNNRVGHLAFTKGDIDDAFRKADVVVRDRFVTDRAFNASIEPRGVAAKPGGEGGVIVTVWTSTQTSHVVRSTVAGALGLKDEQVRLITPCVGGGFGAKGRSYPEEVAVAAIALHLKRPCRWESTRCEDFMATCHGHGVTTEAELAARSDGTLLGLRAHLYQDCGAYVSGAIRPPEYAAQHILGPYRMPAADVEIDAAYTTKSPLTPIRGGGREQGTFVIERLLDHLARQIGADPLSVRERNVLPPDAFPYDTHYPRPHGGSVVYDSGDFPAYLSEARQLIGYDDVRSAQTAERHDGTYRGVAVTLYVEGTAMGREGAHLALKDDGSFFLAVGSPDTGQSHATVMRQICAAELGVPEDQIAFVSGDTQAMGIGTGTFASRFAVMAGNATAQAARDVRQRLLQVAADALEASEHDLEIKDGAVRVTGAPDRSLSLSEVAQKARDAGKPIEATSIFAPDDPTTYTGGAFGAVVDVDVETGNVDIERFVAVHDAGMIINPAVVQGQVFGGVAMGIGEALAERLSYDTHGRLLTQSFDTYVVPRADDIPRMTTSDHSCQSTKNPEGIKGVGESGVIGTLPTIAAAVEDALRPVAAHLNHLPIRAEELAHLCAPLRDGAMANGEHR